MARRPPQHAADARGIYIPPDDDAWDHERIQSEIEKLTSNSDDHPFRRYYSGETRYDLDAPIKVGGVDARITDYIDDAKKPERWELRRLSPRDYTGLINRWGDASGEGRALAQYDACVIGIGGCENGPTLRGAKIGRLTDSDMEYIVGTDLVGQLGTAVIHFSMPLRSDEGKA